MTATPARAETDEAKAAARTAATQGLHAFQEGRYQDAVDFCTRAESLLHAPTHLLLIARAQTKLGHLIEAQEAYIKIERDHLGPKAPKAFVEAQATAADERAALAARVPALKVNLEGESADAQVTLDGEAFPPALVGMASPINPGAHTFAAKSASAVADAVTVTVAEGTKQTVTLFLKPLARAEGAAEAVGPATPEVPIERPPSEHLGSRIAGWVGVGVGVGGLAIGTAFVLKNHADRNDANALCGPSGCPASKRAQIATFDADADAAGTMAWIGYGIGAAGLVAGATLLWLGHDEHDKAAAARSPQITPLLGARSLGVRVTF